MALVGFAAICLLLTAFLCGVRVGIVGAEKSAAKPKQLSPLDEAIRQIEAMAPTGSGSLDGATWVKIGPYRLREGTDRLLGQVEVGNAVIPGSKDLHHKDRLNTLIARKLVELATEENYRQLSKESACHTGIQISSLNSDTKSES